jgi:hypothetical protein
MSAAEKLEKQNHIFYDNNKQRFIISALEIDGLQFLMVR